MDFRVFLRVFFEKERVWVWCFDGEFVVECAAEMEAQQ